MTSAIHLELMQTTALRWETSTRYYVGLVQENLFGQWELIRAWGGRGNRLGGMLVEPAPSKAHALQLLAVESKRRGRRGYTLASPRGDTAVAPSASAGQQESPQPWSVQRDAFDL